MDVFRSQPLFAKVGPARSAFPEHHLFVRVVSGMVVNKGDREIGTGLNSFPSPLCEHWLSDEPLRRGQADDLHYAHNAHVLVGWMPVAAGVMAEQKTMAIYQRMLDVTDATGFTNFARIWHYLPDLNGEERGVSRYRAFCKGRRRALAKQTGRGFCAATVIGTQAEGCIIFIALREPVTAIENPRQVSAVDYPMYSDVDKPLFSRATRLPWGDLFISGTASIVGSESMHAGDTAAEFSEILRNLKSLLSAAGRGDLNRIAHMKAYLVDETKRDIVRRALAENNLTFPVAFLQGQICRPELTVEVEATVPRNHA